MTKNKKPIIVLTGTHGSGKTTLAKKLAEYYDIPFIGSGAVDVQQKFNSDARQEVDIFQRILMQKEILKTWQNKYTMAVNGNGGGVFDRSPIDFVAYMYAESRRNMSDIGNLYISEYTSECLLEFSLDVTAHSINLIYVPIFKFDTVCRGETKAPGGIYANFIDLLIKGLVTSFKDNVLILDDNLEDDRVKQVANNILY